MEILNHENARIAQAGATSVSRELFDATVKILTEKIDELKKESNYGSGRTSGKEWLIGVVVALVALAIALLK